MGKWVSKNWFRTCKNSARLELLLLLVLVFSMAPKCPICGDDLTALKSDALKATWAYDENYKWGQRSARLAYWFYCLLCHNKLWPEDFRPAHNRFQGCWAPGSRRRPARRNRLDRTKPDQDRPAQTRRDQQRPGQTRPEHATPGHVTNGLL